MSGEKRMTRIYLVRHGEAMGNVQEFFQGRIDCDLSPKGEKQLERLAERFKSINYDVIYSSPLIRAMKTADAVNSSLKLPIIKDERLIEINGGAWEGMKWTEIAEKYPIQHDIWKNDMKRFSIDGGETMTEVYERMKNAVTNLADINRGKTVVIVSHGCALRNYLSCAEFGTSDRLADVGWSDNTAVSLVEYDDSLNPAVVFKNDSAHLPHELSTLAFSQWSKYDEKK